MANGVGRANSGGDPAAPSLPEPAPAEPAGGDPARRDPARRDLPSVHLDELRPLGLAAGLSTVGVTSAEPLEPARSVLPRRRSAGLAADMQFTYRNPDRSTDPTRHVPGARSLVVATLDYRTALPDRPGGLQARVARYAWSDHYERLRQGLEAMADELRRRGHRARVVADSNALVDRNAAWRAGLGWYGKNTNLLVPDAGSWYVLGAIVTDALVEGGQDPQPDGCGSCRACIDDCPTEAIVAPGVLDARRCIAWLVQSAEPIPRAYRAAVGDRLYGCDICQEVCPPNRMADRRDGTDRPPADGDAWVEVAWVLEADDEALLDRYGRWYLADRDPDVLRRTALVILGNIGSAQDPTVVRLLERYIRAERELLRIHAVWAAGTLGLHALVEGCADDPSPAVQAERARF
ncbi:MAG: tRNA epoxyqueuosine(34) reductase QueG [Actinomycetota bacterium]